MQQIRIGIQLASLRQPLEHALKLAVRLGADAVELDARHDVRPQDFGETASRHLKKRLADFNLRVSAVAFPTRRGYETPDDLDRRVSATKEAMSLAYRLGANAVLNHIGPIDLEDEEATSRQVQVLADLAKHGQRVGAFLAATTGPDDADAWQSLQARLDDGELWLNLNPGELLVNGHSPAELVQRLGDRVLHVQATDGVADRSRGRGVETQLGRGSADFPELVALLEEQGFRGYFTIERRRADDPVLEIGQSVKYLRSLLH